MLKLKNIKKSNGVISADYFPEGRDTGGFVSIRIADGEVVSKSVPDMELNFQLYYSHAVAELKRLMEKEELPEEKMVMWY